MKDKISAENYLDFDVDRVLNDDRFKKWLENFSSNGNEIDKLSIKGIIEDGQKIYSILIEISFHNSLDHYVRSVLIRGPAVVVVPVLFSETFERSKYLVVEQVRVATGATTREFPSGGCGSGSKLEAAVTELYEETGVRVDPCRLIELESDVVVCESAFDETATWFLVVLDPAEVRFGIYGDESGNEYTATKIIDWDEIKKIKTFHMLAARSILRDYYCGNDKSHIESI